MRHFGVSGFSGEAESPFRRLWKHPVLTTGLEHLYAEAVNYKLLKWLKIKWKSQLDRRLVNNVSSAAASRSSSLGKYVVPATVMLSFVSFWRAAAIVLSDLGSSAYYVGGIAEQKIGKTAPWFVLGIMLLSYGVRAVYIESCSMFTRGGVYKVVHEAMGSTAAKFSVAALMFDYVLTGPISAVSAGIYLARLLNQLAGYLHLPSLHVPPPTFAAGFAILVVVYFWWANTVGIPFSSTNALRIMQITTVMVVTLITWCLLTIFQKGYQPVPAPTLANLKFSADALGWLKGTPVPGIAAVAIFIGLGHSLLAMSGEESLAQVYREIEAPKRRNLMRTGLIIFVYSLAFTSLVSFFAVMLIPDGERTRYYDNLISGIAMALVGPKWLRLAFQGFVVVVGVLILSAAVNTSIIGSNGVLNRVAEDGVLPGWFREPHQRYGTTYRLIALIALLQVATVIITRGDVTLLGETYAFGVAWSFAMKALGVTVLRFTRPDADRWRVPLNLRVAGLEIPVGLILITTILFLLAGVNLFTKKAATIGGVSFTIVFFIAFTLSERYQKRSKTPRSSGREVERFRLEVREDLSAESLQVRPGNILVAVHDPERLHHLEKILAANDPAKADIVVLSVNTEYAPHGSDSKREEAERIVDEGETRVFSTAVAAAETAGKPVALVALPGGDPYRLIFEAAQKLHSARVVAGASSAEDLVAQRQEIEHAWREMPEPRRRLSVDVIPNDDSKPVHLELT